MTTHLPPPDLTIGHSDEALLEYGRACVDQCIAVLRALKDARGVNDDGQAWLERLTRGDCVVALLAMRARGEEGAT